MCRELGESELISPFLSGLEAERGWSAAPEM